LAASSHNSSSINDVVKLWDVATGEEMRTLNDAGEDISFELLT
jgi:hypothetical protein